MIQSIQLPSSPPHSPHPILNLGFRIFFAAAAIFAMVTMAVWHGILSESFDFSSTSILPFFWHGHEMIYGYACAVIAGFLLTAVKTWTSQPMPYGWRLFLIFLPWLLARICWVFIPSHGMIWLILACVFDLLFWGMTTFAIIKPIVQVRQKKQIGIVAKLCLLFLGQAIFYVGAALINHNFQRIGLYLGLYLVIGVVLTIGRRVIPFFIERGVNENAQLKNSNLADRLSLVSFLLFMVVDVFFPNPYLVSIFAVFVAMVNLVRLAGWHTKGIWQKPLLWSLYLSFLGMCIGFLLFAIQPWLGFTHSLAVHALALSGIGLMTLSMMSRVSLGHTGRNIHQPPKTVSIIFGLTILAFFVRVFFPMVWLTQYTLWLNISQILWILSFLIFCLSYLPILAKPRVDGLFG